MGCSPEAGPEWNRYGFCDGRPQLKKGNEMRDKCANVSGSTGSGASRGLFSLWFAVVLPALVAGCAGYRAVQETPVDELISQTQALQSGGYVAQIGDVLTVRFYYDPELDYDVPVRPDGRISLSLIGDVPAEGRSMAQLSSVVTEAYRVYLKQPDATVIMRSPNGHRVFVTGEVLAPGVFTLQGTETALSALSLAGGLSDRATYDQVVLIRRQQGRETVSVLNLQRALDGSDPRQDVTIMMNDVVYVPRTGAAQSDVVLKNLIWNKAPFSMAAGATATWNGTIK